MTDNIPEGADDLVHRIHKAGSEVTFDPDRLAIRMDQETLRSLLMGEYMPRVEEPRPSRNDLFGALATAQGEIQAAEASQENTHFDYKYANLQNCLDACRKPLAENELAVIQLPTVLDGGVVQVTTILGHSSGQSISQVMTMAPDNPGPQAVGSCITYLRRYMLCAMVGIGQQDDDANAATADPDEYERITKIQMNEILLLANKLFGEREDEVIDRMLSKLFDGILISDLPANNYDQVTGLLNNQSVREIAAAKKAEKKPAKPKADKEKLAEIEADKK